MRVFLILLRIGVFLLVLVGAGVEGALGYKWWSDFHEPKRQQELALARKRLAALETLSKSGFSDQTTAKGLREANEKQEDVTRLSRANLFMFAGVVVALIGGVLVLMGRTQSGALLLLLAFIGPTVLAPENVRTALLIFASPLVAAALGSLFVGFLAFVTRPKPEAGRDRDEEEESPRPRSAKRKSAREDEDEEPAITTKPAAKQTRELDEDEEEPPSKPAGKRRRDFEEDEEPARPAKKASSKRQVDEEDEEEPPARPSPKRKRD